MAAGADESNNETGGGSAVDAGISDDWKKRVAAGEEGAYGAGGVDAADGNKTDGAATDGTEAGTVAVAGGTEAGTVAVAGPVAVAGGTEAGPAALVAPVEGATGAEVARPVRSMPQAWQLVCPRKTSFAPQNWQVGLPDPWPSVTLDLSSGAALRPPALRSV